MISEKTLKIIEFDKIRETLCSFAGCCISRELAQSTAPCDEFSRAAFALNVTSEAESFLIKTGYSPVDDFPDIREQLHRMHAVLFVSPAELLSIASCLRAIRSAKSALKGDGVGNTLKDYASTLMDYSYIEDEINRCILNADELYDNASSTLASIRRQMKLTNERVRDKLNSFIRSSETQKYLQDPIITMRNGRFVIPVKQEYRSHFPGLIHDRSGTGATLFIEPNSIVELGNEYKRLEGEERAEVERILAALTALIAPHSNDILTCLETLGIIDIAFARGKLSRSMNAIKPKLTSDGKIKIIKGRHPLIDPKKVVPIDLWIGDEFRTLIITGPNTGGKTVTVKTVGLFTAMAMSGMFIPAAEGSSVSFFENIFADIGDEQSIEQSLSTFSSHMKNIVHIIDESGYMPKSSLILIDELGAGTDPIEGAALAMSILDTLHESGCTTLATTHYSEIKAFALSRKGMENASMEFDVNKLCPTYRLFVGIPGRSNAFEISKRLGLSDEIIEKAKGFLKKEDVKFEDILSNADESRKIAERERELATQARRELYELREQAEKERAAFEEEKEKLKRKAKEDSKKLVADTKRELESLITKLRNTATTDSSARERAIQEARDELRRRESELNTDDEPKKPIDNGQPPKTLSPGQTVKVLSLDSIGTVLSAPDSKGDVTLQLGILKTTVNIKDLRLCADPKEKPITKTNLPKRKSVSLEMDIRGLLVDEAIPVVDAYLDDAYLAGLNEVNIIHGKGTGALRAGIRNYLKHHKRVKSYRDGAYGQGDAGVTVITIRR